ncbi:MAG: hypothetical protein CBC12_07730 [Candidatus Puniceispirillum sp. TMED52]|nr:hypothetical protein [SAR116 cluster bacterium]OUU49324.1 MAG: hypothetical protein CBC12_07730 [Candidatus Puniceispirillum sp. TMED52]|tara:strand:- start:1396 stop:2826 length:1431 start_codon:yes stop_codon:yes gene_type:complete
MTKANFFRKIAFGLNTHQARPDHPIDWAKSQLDNIPDMVWDGSIPTIKDMLNYYGKFVSTDRRVLRKKHKGDRAGYESAKEKLRSETGERYFENLELCIRHNTILKSGSPVFERLWMFWCNHFAIIDKDFLAEFSTGPYHREIIRQHMTGQFLDLAVAATTSWAMIHNLDNSESVGPNSKKGLRLKQKGRVISVNENHARELLELHTVSPSAGYTQDDVVALSYIMAGWEHPWTKKREECNMVKFNQKLHEPGKHTVLGKTYKQRGISSKNKLLDVLADLAQHEHTRHFIAFKLCRHFITDQPTEAMMAPIVSAWEETGGHLPSIHRALVEVIYAYTDDHLKFQNPEVWMLQMVNLAEMNWPPQAEDMTYDFIARPGYLKRRPEKLMREIGHMPYRPIQPNGFSDLERDWISPELLIRRLALPQELSPYIRGQINFEDIIEKNCSTPDEPLQMISKMTTQLEKLQYVFPGYWMLKA